MIFEHRNLQKKGRQLTANLSAQNFLLPREDLGFRVEYKQPYLWGRGDPHRAALVVSAFNSRKLSGVFTPGAPACCGAASEWDAALSRLSFDA